MEYAETARIDITDEFTRQNSGFVLEIDVADAAVRTNFHKSTYVNDRLSKYTSFTEFDVKSGKNPLWRPGGRHPICAVWDVCS